MEKLSQSLEDYLEAIYVISQEKKIVRVKDLVKKLNVKTASVIGALKKLELKGYLEHEHYGYIDLTPEGITKANRIYEKHQVLFGFLTRLLHVGEETADKDACAIEHCISDETYAKLIKLIQFIENPPAELSQLGLKLRNHLQGDNKESLN